MIDSHCHLDFSDFNGERDRLVADAARAGVHTIVNIGVDLTTSRKSIELAERFDSVYATIGVHPHDARTLTPQVLAELRRMADHPKVRAIGEIGLDFYRDLSPRDTQRHAFRRQLQLAIETKLPVVIHSRESLDECIAILRDVIPDLPGAVFHCFPGDVDDALEVIDIGCIISVGGVITYTKSRMARVAAEVPLDKIMLETDAPYLTPVPFRGKRNQPACIKYICDRIAELRAIDAAEVDKLTDRTARRFFGLEDTFGG
jgi:TatD DNase family protein